MSIVTGNATASDAAWWRLTCRLQEGLRLRVSRVHIVNAIANVLKNAYEAVAAVGKA